MTFADLMQRVRGGTGTAPTGTRGRLLGALAGEEERAGGVMDAYEERALGYDPYASAERAGMATGRRMFDDFGRDLADLRGSLVGAGRLRGGYGQEDEGRLYDRFEDRLAGTTAERSMQAAGLELGNIQGLGSYGQNAQHRYLSLLSGQADRELMERNARRDRRSGLFGAVAGVAGTALGGPIGGAIGGWLGKKLGNE
jgi:hypothetical protein